MEANPRKRFDAGYLIVLAICFLALWPFLSRPALPEGTDAELHIFRLAELSYLVRGGEIYPRWAPNFYHGYGYPIFNYYAPLTYYLGLPVDWLPWADAVLAVKTVFVAGLLLAGVGMYGFVRDNWGRWAGYVAAAVYVYAPYVQYVDPHVRGVLPESFSFATFILALWGLDRLRQRPGRWAWLAAVAATAAVILTHNLMGLMFFAVLSAWVGWQILLSWLRNRRQVGAADGPGRLARRLLPALFLGLGLAAVFWLPVILERDAVTLNTLIGAGDNYDFRTHYLSLGEMLSLSQSPDWGATQSPFRFNLGLAQWTLGGFGILLLLLNRVRHRAHAAFFALTLAALLLMMLPASEPIWEAFPFMPYFQFPWRLLGGAAAMLAVLAGVGLDGLCQSLTPRCSLYRLSWIAAAFVAAPLLLGLPLSQPTPWPDFGEVNVLRMSLIENSGRWLGTTSTADYVPKTVEMLPERKSSVVANLEIGLPPDRVNREAMPDGATVTAEQVRPLLTRYYVSAPKQFRLRLYQFDFPGWQVRLDGRPAQTELARPEGFIVVLVPEGEHIVEVEFGSTPARSLATAISLVSLGLALIIAWRWPRRTTAPTNAAPDVLRADRPIMVVVAAITLSALLLEPLGLFHHDSSGRDLDAPGAVEQYADFGDQIALLGYKTRAYRAGPGEAIDLSLYWKALRPLEIDYQSFVHILSPDGALVAQSDKLNPGDFPTRRWPDDKYVPDEHRLQLPADLSPGVYRVVAGLWVQSEGWRLPLFDEEGRQIGDNVMVYELEVE